MTLDLPIHRNHHITLRISRIPFPIRTTRRPTRTRTRFSRSLKHQLQLIIAESAGLHMRSRRSVGAELRLTRAGVYVDVVVDVVGVGGAGADDEGFEGGERDDDVAGAHFGCAP